MEVNSQIFINSIVFTEFNEVNTILIRMTTKNNCMLRLPRGGLNESGEKAALRIYGRAHRPKESPLILSCLCSN